MNTDQAFMVLALFIAVVTIWAILRGGKQ